MHSHILEAEPIKFARWDAIKYLLQGALARLISTILVLLTTAAIVYPQWRPESVLSSRFFVLVGATLSAILVWRLGTARLRKAEIAYKVLDDLVREVVAHSSDDVASKIVDVWAKSGKPFALYLRGFELEAYRAPLMDGRGASVIRSSDRVEQKLAEIFKERLPIIGVENPEDLFGMVKGRAIPRLCVSAEGWEEVVDCLIRAAGVVVISIGSMTPGIAIEFDSLRKFRKQNVTIAVLRDRPDETLEHVADTLGIVRAVGKPVHATDPILSEFAIVVSERDVDGLRESPRFIDLLNRASPLDTHEFFRVFKIHNAALNAGSVEVQLALDGGAEVVTRTYTIEASATLRLHLESEFPDTVESRISTMFVIGNGIEVTGEWEYSNEPPLR